MTSPLMSVFTLEKYQTIKFCKISSSEIQLSDVSFATSEELMKILSILLTQVKISRIKNFRSSVLFLSSQNCIHEFDHLDS